MWSWRLGLPARYLGGTDAPGNKFPSSHWRSCGPNVPMPAQYSLIDIALMAVSDVNLSPMILPSTRDLERAESQYKHPPPTGAELRWPRFSWSFEHNIEEILHSSLPKHLPKRDRPPTTGPFSLPMSSTPDFLGSTPVRMSRTVSEIVRDSNIQTTC